MLAARGARNAPAPGSRLFHKEVCMSSMQKKPRPRLGRGLSSLLSNAIPVSIQPLGSAAPGTPQLASPEAAVVIDAAPSSDRMVADAVVEPETIIDPADQTDQGQGAGGLIWVSVEDVEPNPYQPRRTFDESALEQLAASIRQDGVMQPLVIRRPGNVEGGVYQLVAGERRWRAARRAGLTQVPALLHELDDRQLAEWAVIENLQREDLNPMERAEAFARLIGQFNLTQQEVAERVGADRSTVANLIRLLELHADIQELVRLNKLTAGHARALLALPSVEAQLALAKRAVAGGWSVRMVEAAVKRLSGTGNEPEQPSEKPKRSAHLGDLEQQIAIQLSTKVHIKPARKKGAGTLLIEFYDLDQFDALLGRLGVEIS